MTSKHIGQSLLMRRQFSTTARRSRAIGFISASQLRDRLASKNGAASTCKVLDGSWYLPNNPRDARREFADRHVPGARYFDLDDVKDHQSPFPHMLPTPAEFASKVGRLGIRKTDDIVVYDCNHPTVFSAPRVAWTFTAFGHAGKVDVLDGGLAGWIQAGYETESSSAGDKEVEAVEYGDAEPAHGVVGFDELVKLLKTNGAVGAGEGKVQILDARTAGRFSGSAPEPRPGLSSGHMPGALSTPFHLVLKASQPDVDATNADANEETLKSPEELRQQLEKFGVNLDPQQETIVSCGTGVTAVVVKLALERAGIAADKIRVYDESWTGYADPTRAGAMDGMIVKDE